MRQRLRSGTFLLAALGACSSASDGMTDVPAEVHLSGGVEYRAETAVMESFPVQLHTRVTARNTGAQEVELVFPDGCVVLLRAYADDERSGEPVWDQSRNTFCTMALVEVPLAAGASEQFDVRLDAADVLADSLPDGRYYLTAFLRESRGAFELTAGAVDLAVQRERTE